MPTDIEAVKIETGLAYFEDSEFVMSDNDIQYYLDKNNGSVRKTVNDVAQTTLFILSQYVHSKTAVELEIWGHSFFENYMKALQMKLKDPNYSIALAGGMPYAGGISKTDVVENVSNVDTIYVDVESKAPTDNYAQTLDPDPFDPDSYRTTTF